MVLKCVTRAGIMAKEPESWGELVANYRDDYGSRSYQTIKKTERHDHKL